MEIKMNLTKTPKEKPDQSKLGFGKFFTDHMFIMDWDSENGWHELDDYALFQRFEASSIHAEDFSSN